MRRAEFIKFTNNYVVNPGESCNDGQVHLQQYREAHLILDGYTRYRCDARLQRQVAVFGVVDLSGKWSYHVFHSDHSEQGTVVGSCYSQNQVKSNAKGMLIESGFPNENIFLPAADSTAAPLFGSHKLKTETVHESLQGDNNLPLPDAAMPVSFLRDLVATEKAR